MARHPPPTPINYGSKAIGMPRAARLNAASITSQNKSVAARTADFRQVFGHESHQGGRVVENEALVVGRGHHRALLVRLCKRTGRAAWRWWIFRRAFWRLFACAGPFRASQYDWRWPLFRCSCSCSKTEPVSGGGPQRTPFAWRPELRGRRLRQWLWRRQWFWRL